MADISIDKLIEIIYSASVSQTLKKAVFSKPLNAGGVRVSGLAPMTRAVGTLRSIGGETVLQIEFFRADNKVTHENLKLSDLSRVCELVGEVGQVNVITTCGDCELKRSKSGKTTLIGGDKLLSLLKDNKGTVNPISGNDNEKKRILTGNEEFLKLLGVSDQNGRVYDKKRSKFKQINRFLELVRDAETSLPSDKILIYDLCCGKSYLSFAVYHYFKNIKHIDTEMYGVDLKDDVVDYCNEVANKLHFDGLKFYCQDIRTVCSERDVDLVVSLHACDIATDIVLDKAVEWNTKVILSTPCCHHEMNRILNCPELSFISDHSMLKQKFCDAATDSLRLLKLRANGYDTAALELIDPDETPKNIMLKGIKRKRFYESEKRKLEDEYIRAYDFLVRGVTHQESDAKSDLISFLDRGCGNV